MTTQTNGHVAVVDDSLTVRMMLQEQLQQAGYQVTLFEDGDAVVEYLKATADWPDLVLLDLVMPGIDGISVLEFIKSQDWQGFLPVILLTSMSDIEDRVRGLDQGAEDYIAKPFDSSDLLARVRAQLRIKRLQDEMADQNIALAKVNQENHRLLQELEVKNEQLKQAATTDALTGLNNRGEIERFVTDESARVRRFAQPLAVAMIDIDHFKLVNDTLGHPFGDRVIREVARVMAETVREVDRVGRYGGEEFLLVLPGTDVDGAVILADRIRSGVEALCFDPEGKKVTVSAGVACWDGDDKGWEEMVSRADQALYQAKESGRNRVCTPADDLDPVPG